MASHFFTSSVVCRLVLHEPGSDLRVTEVKQGRALGWRSLGRHLDREPILHRNIPAGKKQMSSSYYRSQLERVQRHRADAERRVGELRKTEANRRSASSRARESAERSKMHSARAGRLREAARLGVAANTAGVEAARWQTKVAGFVKDEAMLRVKLDRADRSEREASERRRAREEQVSARRAASRGLVS